MQLTPDEIEAERQQFEAWWIQNVLGFNCKPTYVAGHGYVLLLMHCAWESWLAAIASERARRKQEQADKVSEGIVDPFCNWAAE